MTAATKNITITKGDTFSLVLRWEIAPFVYKAITAITKAAPARITATAHGMVDGWRAAIVSVVGMREINSKNTPPRSTDFHKVTYVDANTVDINDVNSALYTAYTSGGYLQYYTAKSLSGYTARMMIRPTIDDTDTALVSLTSPSGGIVVDDTAKTITITIAATATAAYTFLTGAWDIELVSGDATPVVTKLLSGNVTVIGEVTRS